MDIQAVKSEAEELLSVSYNPTDTEKSRIEILYKDICNKPVRECNCRDRWHDALIEILLEIRNLKKVKTQNIMANYKVRHGCVVEIDNTPYVSEIPDAAAKKFIRERLHNKQRLVEMWFEVFPEPAKEAVKEPAKPKTEGTSVNEDTAAKTTEKVAKNSNSK